MIPHPPYPTLFPYTTLFRSAFVRPVAMQALPQAERQLDARDWPGFDVLRVEHHEVRVVAHDVIDQRRSEEHTSELQSHVNLVCRLLLEKKKKHGKYNREKCN